MSNVIRSLIVRVGADLGNFDRRMKDMKKMLNKTGSQMQRTGKQMTKTFTVPFTASAVAVGKFTKIAMQYSNMLDKMSVRTGITTDNLQKLEFVSSQLGVNFDSTRKATTKLSQALSQGENSKIFKELGIEVRDAKGELKDMSTIFFDSISSLRNIKNPTEQGAVAFKLFGRQAEELLPIFRASDEAVNGLITQFDGLGLTVGSETIQKFVMLTDRLDVMRKQFRKISIDIASAFLPVVEKMGGFIESRFIPTIKKFTSWLGSLSNKTKINIALFGGLLAAIGPLLFMFGTALKVLVALNIKFILFGVAIAGAITWLVNLYQKSEEFRNTVNRMIQYIKILYKNFVIGFTAIYNSVAPLIEKITNYMTTTFFAALQFLEKLLAAFVWSVEGNLEDGSNKWLDVWESWSNLSNLIFFGFFEGVITAFDKFWTWIFDKTDRGINWLSEQMNKIPFVDIGITDTSSNFKMGMDEIKRAFDWMKDTAGIDKIKNDINDAFKFDSKLNIDIENSPFTKLSNFFKEWNLDLDNTETALNNITSNIGTFVNAIRQQTNSFANFVGLFDNFQSQTLSPRRLLRRLQAQTRAIGEWQKNIATLESRGISGELLQELRNMGVSQSGAIKGLTRMTDDQLNQYMGSYSQKMNIAGQEAYKTVAGQQKIDTMIESQINITITDSNIRSADDTERVAKEIVRKLKLTGINI